MTLLFDILAWGWWAFWLAIWCLVVLSIPKEVGGPRKPLDWNHWYIAIASLPLHIAAMYWVTR